MYMNKYNTRQTENIYLENKGEKEMGSDRIRKFLQRGRRKV